MTLLLSKTPKVDYEMETHTHAKLRTNQINTVRPQICKSPHEYDLPVSAVTLVILICLRTGDLRGKSKNVVSKLNLLQTPTEMSYLQNIVVQAKSIKELLTRTSRWESAFPD